MVADLGGRTPDPRGLVVAEVLLSREGRRLWVRHCCLVRRLDVVDGNRLEANEVGRTWPVLARSRVW